MNVVRRRDLAIEIPICQIIESKRSVCMNVIAHHLVAEGTIGEVETMKMRIPSIWT